MSEQPPALLVVDVQRGFDEPVWGARNNPGAEAVIARLLAAWREAGAPVIHVRHASRAPDGVFRPGTPAFEFKPEAAPAAEEPVLEKRVNSAFIGTDLEGRLRDAGADTVVVAGLTTDHCCSTTARMAANLGFDTWFVSDATATFERRAPDGGTISADDMHRTELASLHGEFADVVSADEAIARLVARRQAASARASAC